ncbi:MAG: Hint domain-containing protein [Halobacteriovoraceae bacterium]|nr:Hint domain-containing protein [Halobacteriovoraceae bacterium]
MLKIIGSIRIACFFKLFVLAFFIMESDIAKAGKYWRTRNGTIIIEESLSASKGDPGKEAPAPLSRKMPVYPQVDRCLNIDAVVLMEDGGRKKISTMQVGDPAKVLRAIVANETENLYRIVFTDDSETFATEFHPLGIEGGAIRAPDIRSGDLLEFSEPVVKEVHIVELVEYEMLREIIACPLRRPFVSF